MNEESDMLPPSNAVIIILLGFDVFILSCLYYIFFVALPAISKAFFPVY